MHESAIKSVLEQAQNVQKGNYSTCPSQARQDALLPEQGRSEGARRTRVVR
jgi:hypothetical protein